MFRRLMLTGILVLVGGKDVSQLFIGILISVFWVAVLAYNRPYGDYWDNFITIMLSVHLAVTLISGMALKLFDMMESNKDQAEKNALGLILVIISWLSFLLSTLAIVMSTSFVRDRLDKWMENDEEKDETNDANGIKKQRVKEIAKIEHGKPTVKYVYIQHPSWFQSVSESDNGTLPVATTPFESYKINKNETQSKSKVKRIDLDAYIEEVEMSKLKMSNPFKSGIMQTNQNKSIDVDAYIEEMNKNNNEKYMQSSSTNNYRSKTIDVDVYIEETGQEESLQTNEKKPNIDVSADFTIPKNKKRDGVKITLSKIETKTNQEGSLQTNEKKPNIDMSVDFTIPKKKS